MINKALTTIKNRDFRRFLGAPRRFVKRRGFGIHSPFAFDFVRRVVAQPCAFYCYPQLDAAARKAGVKASVLRLVFRVVLFFRPSHVDYLGHCGAAVKKAVDAACPRIDVCVGPRLIVASGALSASERELVLKSAQDEAVVIFLNLKADAEASNALWAAAKHGMMFRGSDMAIYVGLGHLPRQIFNVWL